MKFSKAHNLTFSFKQVFNFTAVEVFLFGLACSSHRQETAHVAFYPLVLILLLNMALRFHRLPIQTTVLKDFVEFNVNLFSHSNFDVSIL